jgi:hypothetical protein
MSTREASTPPAHLLWVHGRLVLLVTLVTVAVAATVGMSRGDLVTATSRVLALPTTSYGTAMPPEMGTEREIALSGDVAALAAEDLEMSAADALTGLEVEIAPDTDVLTFRYSSFEAEHAMAGVAAFTRAYLDLRNSWQSVRAARVITPPVVDEEVPGISFQVILVAALLLGLLLGAAAAWGWDRVSGRLRSPGELEDTGLPIMYEWSPPPHGSDPSLEFGHLAVYLASLAGGRRHGLRIVVTGTQRGVGNSAVSLGLAVAVANLGRSVVLLDADTRAPGVTGVLGVEDAPTLSSLAEGDVALEKALQPCGQQNLMLVATPVRDATPPHAGLQIDGLRLLVGQLAGHGIVVIDAPPVTEEAESLMLSQQADVVLVVVAVPGGDRSSAVRAARLVSEIADANTPKPLTGWVVRRGGPGPRRHLGVVSTTTPNLSPSADAAAASGQVPDSAASR